MIEVSVKITFLYFAKSKQLKWLVSVIFILGIFFIDLNILSIDFLSTIIIELTASNLVKDVNCLVICFCKSISLLYVINGK